MWGAESVSENCASEIGATEGCLMTRCRIGAGGGGGGGRATGSAPAGRAGTGRVVAMLPIGRVSELTA